jgi:DNA-binding NarL/FixJ family response regulator
MAGKVTVLLADDHHLVRRGFRRLLEDDPGVVVVGEASDGDEAVRLAEALTPDVIVMDCAMQGMSGLAATRQILERRPDAAVLMLSMHAEQTLVSQALAAGARGYVLKNATDLDLASAVKRVASGETVLDPTVTPALALRGQRHHGLSPRELEVLQLICQGHANRAIATKLGLSVNTVSVHRASIMSRLGVHKTAELVLNALRHGLVGPL